MTEPEASDDDSSSSLSSCCSTSTGTSNGDNRRNSSGVLPLSRKRPRSCTSNNDDDNEDDTEMNCTNCNTNNDNINNKSFIIEWPTDDKETDDEDDGHHHNNKLNAIVTFYKTAAAVVKPVVDADDYGTWKHDKLCLMGRAQISCLEGSITILGYRLDSSSNSSSSSGGGGGVEKIQIESPPWSSLLVLEPDQTTTSSNSSSLMPVDTSSSSSATTTGAAKQQKLAVIKVESWWPHHPSAKATPKEDREENHRYNNHHHTSSSSSAFSEPTFELLESNASSVKPTYIPSRWKTVLDQALPELDTNNDDDDNDTDSKVTSITAKTKKMETKEEDDRGDGCNKNKSTNNTTTTTNNANNNTNNKSFRMAICGAKGVGKSTFLRYATNRILSSNKYNNNNNNMTTESSSSSSSKRRRMALVAILDADVGQPEMSPPGMITLTIISNPILTPPHYRSMAMPTMADNHNDDDDDDDDDDDYNDNNNHDIRSGQQQQQRYYYYQQYSHFFGGVTSKQDPSRYLQFLKRLIQKYEELLATIDNNDNNNNNNNHPQEQALPLLINLDGWVKGLGYELLSTMLTEILDPTHVVQIVGTTKSKQFTLREVLNPEVSRARLHVVHSYNSTMNFYDAGLQQQQQQVVQVRPTTATTTTTTPSLNITVPVGCDMPAQHLRTIRLCTYFLNDVTIWYDLGFNHEGIRDDYCEIAHRLSGELPYAVPFEAVEILWEGSDHFSDLQLLQLPDDDDEEDNEEQQVNSNFNDLMLDAINAKIVGLCCRRRRNDDDDDEEDDELVSCVGLGLVRAIDRVQRILYILTPVHPKKLQLVNVLVGGMLDVPLEFWFRGVHASAFPYQSFAPPGNATIGADPMKSRNNIGRKGLTNGAT